MLVDLHSKPPGTTSPRNRSLGNIQTGMTSLQPESSSHGNMIKMSALGDKKSESVVLSMDTSYMSTLTKSISATTTMVIMMDL